jgi:hypothetical protein
MTGNANLQQLNISNIALIHDKSGSSSGAPIFYYNTTTCERHYLNLYNLYIRNGFSDNAGYIIYSSTNTPANTVISVRECYQIYANEDGVAYNFTGFSGSSIDVALRLRDNIFYAKGAGSGGTTGHIISRAQNGSDWDWFWQGNLFYSTWSASTQGARNYMWYDSGSTTSTCLLINTTESIANWDTVNSPPIALLSPVPLYGYLKIPAPRWFNRS